jgi:hypothetical protein
LRIAQESWGSRQALFDAPCLHLTIRMQDGSPPQDPPRYEPSPDGFSLVCDSATRGEFSIRAHSACLHVSRTVLERTEWFRYQLLECLVLTALDTVYFVGLHAANFAEPLPPFLTGGSFHQLRRCRTGFRQRENINHHWIALREPFAS